MFHWGLSSLERKEAKLKELKLKLIESEKVRKTLTQEIEKLRKVNLEITAENKQILLQTNSNINSIKRALHDVGAPEDEDEDGMNEQSHRARFHHHHHQSSKFSFPTGDESVISSYMHNQNPYYINSQNGDASRTEELLTIPATWEYLQKVSEDRNFDQYTIMQALKGSEVCHEYGPAYPRTLIDMLIDKYCTE